MSSTAARVRRLAWNLSEHTGVVVSATYDRGWALFWRAGPSREQMRTVADNLGTGLALGT